MRIALPSNLQDAHNLHELIRAGERYVRAQMRSNPILQAGKRRTACIPRFAADLNSKIGAHTDNQLAEVTYKRA